MFHEVRFPASLSFGSVGGPERRTEIVSLANGFEERNSPWAHARRHYDAGVGLRSLDDLEALIAFFEARRGQLHGFRWKDWSDYRSCRASGSPGAFDQELGIGDGQRRSFDLCKLYRSGEESYSRPVVKPVAGTVLVGLGGDPQTETVDYSLELSRGRLHFDTAPPRGARVTAGFEFDVPVRFDTDRIALSVASFQAGEMPGVPVVEIRL
ncbi:DUF2460 domain-containing protein [Pseudogemmobacter faecipullorum]|uniref:DUF2460 domain-containing protein n=1 Tax=Pseudogemmobacter faecipullorum TaxID=2755041 RepID=A0ABS8CKU6_9RHOB|nr:DUF2460 domain-containing protein [Pseudogemmobacter faecipullorum]MCB5410018.1 DUF2460 domain-containing protein [Pseudogemmobacter faecipullorum]